MLFYIAGSVTRESYDINTSRKLYKKKLSDYLIIKFVISNKVVNDDVCANWWVEVTNWVI